SNLRIPQKEGVAKIYNHSQYDHGKLGSKNKYLSGKLPETHPVVATEAGQAQDVGVFPTFRADTNPSCWLWKNQRSLNPGFLPSAIYS
ncbi:MAG TPA: hypothetical protein PLF84_22840, partial [Bryobacteraceae bacterium]|nr:hypothetical protein [Bryobacteraceae bacterium]